MVLGGAGPALVLGGAGPALVPRGADSAATSGTQRQESGAAIATDRGASVSAAAALDPDAAARCRDAGSGQLSGTGRPELISCSKDPSWSSIAQVRVPSRAAVTSPDILVS